MKKIISLLLLATLLLTSFAACSSDVTEESLFGNWEVVEGGDDHVISITDRSIQIIDGRDYITCGYTKPSNDVFRFEFDGEIWELKYNDGRLYRYENGEADGYIYERAAK